MQFEDKIWHQALTQVWQALDKFFSYQGEPKLEVLVYLGIYYSRIPKRVLVQRFSFRNGDSEGTRTPDLQRDRLAFYATELRSHLYKVKKGQRSSSHAVPLPSPPACITDGVTSLVTTNPSLSSSLSTLCIYYIRNFNKNQIIFIKIFFKKSKAPKPY